MWNLPPAERVYPIEYEISVCQIVFIFKPVVDSCQLFTRSLPGQVA